MKNLCCMKIDLFGVFVRIQFPEARCHAIRNGSAVPASSQTVGMNTRLSGSCHCPLLRNLRRSYAGLLVDDDRDVVVVTKVPLYDLELGSFVDGQGVRELMV